MRGRPDALIECADGTTAIIDFKTTEPKDAHLPSYANQLRAYASAIENPARGAPAEVSALALACFTPDEFDAKGDAAALSGNLVYIDVPRDDEVFAALLADVVYVLDGEEPPLAAPDCAFCAWKESDERSIELGNPA